MTTITHIAIPSLVRVKPGAIDRLGIYLERSGHGSALLVVSEGLVPEYLQRVQQSLAGCGIVCLETIAVADASFEYATEVFERLPRQGRAIIGLGGGKALDVAKYVAFLARLPYYATPTSFSNDGFSSPQSSLTVAGRRRSLAAAIPYAVIIDLDVCKDAPRPLWLSGVGDLVSKLTAIFDWKLAFHRRGESVNDFAALLSDSTVYQFMAQPSFDLEGARLLGTALMLNGIAMEICGSSRPASGSEHLISHALDALSVRPRLHGLQVGVATYLISRVQKNQTERIAQLFDRTGFWAEVQGDPFSLAEWSEAIRLAPAIKDDFLTILSEPGAIDEAESILKHDSRLRGCFVE
jgi:glycerol-1-phosphate dehydrogenase [NAD(P)+]